MRCPKCAAVDDKVVDSRMSRDGSSIRRRRECIHCGHRYTTYEEVERTDIRVLKRDGRREPLSKEKLLGGMVKACEKRPINLERLEQLAKEIMHELQREFPREVPSRLIGAKVMERLHDLDEVAYVRYASVYRQFEDVGEFIDEIQAIEKRARLDAQQEQLFKY